MIATSLFLLTTGIILLTGTAIYAEIRRVPVEVILRGWEQTLLAKFRHFQAARTQHPRPHLAYLQTALWLLLLLPTLEHLLRPEDGITARLLWPLFIAPHEIGHLLCLPFGRFLMVAGGSIWQLLFWGLLGGYSILVRRQITRGLLFLYLVGHSWLDLSVYIRDAQERDLPLLFGLGEDSHDWYNLLRWTGLLRYDNAFADLAVFFGAVTMCIIISMGIWRVWVRPGYTG